MFSLIFQMMYIRHYNNWNICTPAYYNNFLSYYSTLEHWLYRLALGGYYRKVKHRCSSVSFQCRILMKHGFTQLISKLSVARVVAGNCNTINIFDHNDQLQTAFLHMLLCDVSHGENGYQWVVCWYVLSLVLIIIPDLELIRAMQDIPMGRTQCGF